MKRLAKNFITLFILAGISFTTFPCTTFVLHDGDRIYFGRNLDWDWEDGMVFINPRNMTKRAFVLSQNGIQWTSKYGSVTFNQFAREMPFGGMNEAGLVVENMWLSGTKYPPSDSRPEINMLQWIQYQLDNHSTVAEVIASDKTMRLENTPVTARIHYYVCDATGASATIEFLNGEIRVHHGDELPYRALANEPYTAALTELRSRLASTNVSPQERRTDSASRFCQAALRAESFKKGANREADVAYAFETLEQVRQGDYTVWQMVYDVTERRIHFRTRSNSATRHIDLRSLDFACRQPVLAVDIRAKPAASGTLEFKPLQPQEHRDYVQRFFSQPSLHQTIGDVRALIEPYLMSLQGYRCAD